MITKQFFCEFVVLEIFTKKLLLFSRMMIHEINEAWWMFFQVRFFQNKDNRGSLYKIHQILNGWATFYFLERIIRKLAVTIFVTINRHQFHLWIILLEYHYISVTCFCVFQLNYSVIEQYLILDDIFILSIQRKKIYLKHSCLKLLRRILCNNFKNNIS